MKVKIGRHFSRTKRKEKKKKRIRNTYRKEETKEIKEIKEDKNCLQVGKNLVKVTKKKTKEISLQNVSLNIREKKTSTHLL